MKTKKSLLQYLFADNVRAITSTVIFAVVAIIGIGAIYQGAIWFGIGLMIVVPGVYLLGSWRNMNGKSM
jgi:hypothetical protein